MAIYDPNAPTISKRTQVISLLTIFSLIAYSAWTMYERDQQAKEAILALPEIDGNITINVSTPLRDLYCRKAEADNDGKIASWKPVTGFVEAEYAGRRHRLDCGL